MKDFLFVSDFDGTISQKDFYWMMIDKFMKEEGNTAYQSWKNGDMKDIEFLSGIFASINLPEDELDEEITNIPLDPGVIPLIKRILVANKDFVILSAGTTYYIERILNKHDLSNITIYSNKGIYNEGGIKVITDESSPFYSERYGIDKLKVLNELKKYYKTIYFAGDSDPDVAPSRVADKVFAKNGLQIRLKDEKIDYIPVNSFSEIQEYLEKEGII